MKPLTVRFMDHYQFQNCISKPWHHGLFELVAYVDGVGYFPIYGSGGQIGRCSIPECLNQPIRFCTWNEVLEFLRLHFPTSYQHHCELEEQSMASAML